MTNYSAIEEEEVEIEVEIDRSVKAVITLKKKMTALDFRGVIEKSKQLFNISNKEIVSVPNKSGKGYGSRWTEEQIEKLRELYTNSTKQELLETPELSNMSYVKIMQKAYILGLKKNKGANVENKKAGLFQSTSGFFTDEETKIIEDRVSKGKKGRAICEEFDIPLIGYRRIADKVQAIIKAQRRK